MSLFEKYLEFNGYKFRQAQEELNALSAFSESEISQWQKNQKWELVKFHFKHNPFYKSQIGKSLPNKWEELPVLTKMEMKNSSVSLISTNFKRKDLFYSQTSGTTGQALNFVKNKYAHAHTWALIRHRYNQLGLSTDSKEARFYGLASEIKAKFKEKIKDLIMNRERFDVFGSSDHTHGKILHKLKNGKFDYICGYTNALVLFANYLLKKDVTLSKECPSMKACIITAEKCYQEEKEMMKSAFGMPVINEYGASEVSIIAIENIEEEWMISEENLFLEVIDSNNQIVASESEGKILVTDLHNKAMPFIRYEVGDIGSIKKNRAKNSFHRILSQISGRDSENIHLPSNRTASACAIHYIMKPVREKFSNIQEYTVRQTERDTFVFDIVSKQILHADEKKYIKKKAALYLENNLKIEFNQLSELKPHPSGKRSFFYSEITE